MDLRGLREKHGMSQSEFSSAIGVTVSALSNYENGIRRPRPEIATKIANVLNLSVSEMWELLYEADGCRIDPPAANTQTG